MGFMQGDNAGFHGLLEKGERLERIRTHSGLHSKASDLLVFTKGGVEINALAAIREKHAAVVAELEAAKKLVAPAEGTAEIATGGGEPAEDENEITLEPPLEEPGEEEPARGGKARVAKALGRGKK